MTDAGITVNGVTYLGWTNVSLTRSMEQLAHTFDVSFSERWSGQDRELPILEGDKCKVKLGSTNVLTGFVVDADVEYDADTHSMRVAGLSRTVDLVDCSAVYAAGKGQWRNQDLRRIATDLCVPFNIDVKVDAAVIGEKFRRFALQDGETVHEAIERACRMRGALMLTDSDSQLVITRAGTTRTRTVIRRGENVLSGKRSGSWRDRFSQYIIKAQVAGDDEFNSAAAASPKKVSSDTIIDRHRPLIIQAEGQETGAELQKRADWERNVRSGRAARVSYQVQGWENEEGLWNPNTLVRVKDDWLRVNKELLIVSVRQTKDEGGSITDLELVDPLALSVEPIVAKRDRDEFP